MGDAITSEYITDYIASSTAIDKFADSSNYSTHKSDNDAHHALVTVASAPLTLSTQEVTFNYDNTEFGLNGNDLQLLGYDTISSNAKKGYTSGVALGDLAYLDSVPGVISNWGTL